eukprot:gnl/TRDRNA2_/TRDRNA2_125545_c0_seq1.p1 gnl/TRDRNA2_/TRDRNA2_125545_c0~~gnl/TRDRNA2_/TRDRNA2_125545_c0_seq1.p1  ORF type:complete len:241 (-),score=5.03 gnl/TRDRNA2_/TRDRNA2_125545_c0_seq1:233-955(-)
MAFSWHRGDPQNQAPAVVLLLALTHLGREYRVKRLQAWTIWNLLATVVNFLFKMKWENPLFTNSLAIFLCYRTASVDNHSGLQKRSRLPPRLYALGDTIFHFGPVVAHGLRIYRRGKFVPHQYGAFSLLAQVHFAYAISGSLDVRELYVPHDVKTAWWSAILGHLLGPSFMNCLIAGHHSEAVGLSIAFCSVYLLKVVGWRPFKHDSNESVHKVPSGMTEPSGRASAGMSRICSNPSVNG